MTKTQDTPSSVLELRGDIRLPKQNLEFQGFQRRLLSNGIDFIVLNDTTLKSTRLEVGILAGADFQHMDEAGVAHFLEHVICNTISWQKIPSRFAEENQPQYTAVPSRCSAITDYHSVRFNVELPGGARGELFCKMLSALTERLVFTSKELDEEKRIVLGELGQYECEFEFQREKEIRKALFPHERSSNFVLGTESEIRQISLDMIKRFYSETYIPSRMAVALVGNYNEELSQHIQFILEAIPSRVSEAGNRNLRLNRPISWTRESDNRIFTKVAPLNVYLAVLLLPWNSTTRSSTLGDAAFKSFTTDAFDSLRKAGVYLPMLERKVEGSQEWVQLAIPAYSLDTLKAALIAFRQVINEFSFIGARSCSATCANRSLALALGGNWATNAVIDSLSTGVLSNPFCSTNDIMDSNPVEFEKVIKDEWKQGRGKLVVFGPRFEGEWHAKKLRGLLTII